MVFVFSIVIINSKLRKTIKFQNFGFFKISQKQKMIFVVCKVYSIKFLITHIFPSLIKFVNFTVTCYSFLSLKYYIRCFMIKNYLIVTTNSLYIEIEMHAHEWRHIRAKNTRYIFLNEFDIPNIKIKMEKSSTAV